MDQRDSQLFVAACTAVITSIVTLGGSLVVTWWTQRLKAEEDLKNQRRMAYYRLCAAKILVGQLHASVNRTQIDSAYFQHAASLVGRESSEGKLAVSENGKAVGREQDLLPRLAQEKAELAKTIGSIRVLFKPSKELGDLIGAINLFGQIAVGTDELRTADLTASHQWQLTARAGVDGLIEAQFTKPVDRLLEHLEIQLREDW